MREIAICDDNERDQEIIQKVVDEYMNEKNISHTYQLKYKNNLCSQFSSVYGTGI